MSRISRAALPALCFLALAGAPLAAQAPLEAAPAAAAGPAQPSVALRSGMEQGSTAAAAVGTTTWTLTGFASGLLLGPVGTGLAWSLARSGASSPPAAVATRMEKLEADYRLGYQRAYTDRLTAKRKSSALAGGVAGTTLFSAAAAVLLLR